MSVVAHVPLDGWGVLVWLVAAAFWVLLITVIVYLVRAHVSGPGSRVAALHVLEERYARGEISREEFFERRSVLTNPPSSPPSPPPEPETRPLHPPA